MREAALAVVGENEGVGLFEMPVEEVKVVKERFGVGVGFEVAAKHLLLPRDDAEFFRGGERRIELQGRFDPFLLEERFNAASRGVLTHDGEKRDAGSDVRDVERDVRRAAETFFGADDPHDGHRRFGRNALGVAEPIAVEHGVARDEDVRGKNLCFFHGQVGGCRPFGTSSGALHCIPWSGGSFRRGRGLC